MKRLQRKADAYDWVSDRADHIRDKNPDMDEGEEYGIAWKQYKKKNPGWKSKKQKEKDKKKKKSASRLRYAWHTDALDNRQDDNVDMYNTINELMYNIRQDMDSMFKVKDYFTEVATIKNVVDSVSACASEIDNCAQEAKANGIHNEGQLSIGKDQIQDLEESLKELESELKDILDENDDLQAEVDNIESEIDSIRNELNRLNSEITAAEQQGMVHEERSHVFICYAHDAIMESAREIVDKCERVNNDIDEALTKADGSNDEQVSDEICDCANDLQSDVDLILNQIDRDMGEAKGMNDNMGNGIETKNKRIEELNDEIDEKQDELSNAENNNSDLKSKLEDVKSTLSQLENELSSIGN